MVTESELFERNIGIFSGSEQKAIHSLRVAIGGAGGIGGPVAYGLARLGAGKIKLADPDKFEANNINRQFGSYIDTMGEYKAEAICKELKRINPYGEFEFLNESLGKSNLKQFLDEVDIVVDAIDFFQLEAELLLHEAARQNGQWIYTSQAAGEILTFTAFDPVGTSLKEKITQNSEPSLVDAIKIFFPELPSIATPSLMNELIETKKVHISSHSTPPMIGGGLLIEQIIQSEIKRKRPVIFPKILLVNIDTLNAKIY